MKGVKRYRSGPGIPETAPLWRRVVACALDFLLLITLFAVPVYWRLPATVSVDATARDVAPAAFDILLLVLPGVLVYFTLFELLWGATPGKRALGLRVRTLDGGRPGFMECFLRNLLRLLWEAPGIGQVLLLADIVCVELTEMEQRVGDLAAGTIVVHEGSPTPAAALPRP